MKHLRRFLALAAALLALAAVAPSPSAQDRGDADGQARMRAHRPSVPGVHGLVTSANPLASMAGMRILLAGGNAFDAAVAVATTLNVVEPTSSGIGGNGFATVFDKASGKVWSLSMAGAAPKALEAGSMTADLLDSGIKAGIVPGNLGGYLAILDRFGSMTLAEVLAPAIEYARDGHPINDSFASGVRGRQKVFAGFPTTAAVFMPGGHVPVSGESFRLPALAATFQKLVDAEQAAASGGASRSAAIQAAFDRFYKGDIADAFDRFFREQGGYLRKEDLAAYQPRWDAPVHTTYRGYDIYSNPATSRGGIEVLMQLNLVEGFDLKAMGAESPEALHVLAEA
ncbi:MAG: gamma-glutamyltransferase, partial [Vicinamibacterales bacterium]